MATPDKDTIYIDVDDEITTVIDKVRSSHQRIVALVLPKRATTFQSSVNMKLLKRTADADRKKVVLITSEPGLLPLAAAAGLHVASTLQSKPEVPSLAGVDNVDAPQAESDEPLTVDNSSNEFTSENAGNRSVGELASLSGTPVAGTPSPSDDIESLNIEDDTEGTPVDEPIKDTVATAKKPKNKKLHIPNFEKFRLRLALGILVLIALIVGGVVAFKVMPKAVIDIKTNASSLASTVTFTLDPQAATFDADQKTVPSQQEQEQKTASQQVSATGKKNVGNKASGSITMSVHECTFPISQPSDVPAGTGVSANNLTYITQQDTSFSISQQPDSNGCLVYQADSSTPITASAPGTQYNIDATSFDVAGRSDVTATSADAMTGGTDKTVTVVTQSDIEGATKKLTQQNGDIVKHDLEQKLTQDGLFPVDATFNAGQPSVSSDVQAGDQAENVTVTQTTTYSMYGVHESDLKTLVDNDIKQQIDPNKQTILSEGLDDATFKLDNTVGKTQRISMQTTAVAGPDLNVDSLKQQVAGKKSGEISSLIKETPGVTDVTVKLSPFWVTSAPKNLDKITINVAKPAPISNNAGS